MLLVLTRTEIRSDRTGPRYRWVLVAVAAVLISVLAAGGTGSAATSYDPEELQFLRLINEYREENGVGPLILSDTLAVAAEHHSRDMGEYGFFGHNTAASSYYDVGAKPWDRMEAEGYDYNTTRGENLAAGTETAEESFRAWRESPSHNAAMLDGRYRVVGIARVNTPASRHGWYWTTDFGGALDPTSHAPGESSQGQDPKEPPPEEQQSQTTIPEPQEPPEEREKPPRDGAGIENGAMIGDAIWEQKARDGADLILDDDRARLGGYDNGVDDLRQKVSVGRNTRLAYDLKIETAARRPNSDLLLVWVTDKEGEKLAVLKRYTDEDRGGWERRKVDLSQFAGRTVYVGFHVRTDPALLTSFYLDNVVLKRHSEATARP